MSLFQALLAEAPPPPPPVPPFFDVMYFTEADTGRANVSTRQTVLEPSTAGVDHAMSWSVWICPSNVGTQLMRVFGVCETAANNQQYALQLNLQNTTTSINQKLRFILFTDGSNFINIDTQTIFLRNRWTHVVVTYDGSESNTGLEMYINGVLQTVDRQATGTYTGARNSANLRFMAGAVFGSSGRYRGDMKDLAVWDNELDQTKVTELFNNGLPIDVTTVSFYGSDIVAYWQMDTDTVCTNSATFNLGTVTGITTRNVPVGPDFKKLSIFKATVANANYVAFGGMFKNGPNKFDIQLRSGTTHLANGNIVKISLNSSTLAVTGPITVIDDPTVDLRGGSAGIIDGKVMVFSSRFTGPGTFHNINRYESTDGLIGETFGAATVMPTTETAYNFYGKVAETYTNGEFVVPMFENDGTNYEINLFHRNLAGTWTKSNVWTGTTEKYVEAAICRTGGNSWVMLMRSEASSGLFMTFSTDDRASWSTPAATGLGSSGRANADMCLDPDGNLIVIYMDRGTDSIYITAGNVIADIIADPTDWNTSSQVFLSYTTDSLGICGYPMIERDGFYYAIAFSAEFSSSVTDLYLGYGIIGLGL